MCEQDDIMLELTRRWRWVGHILRKDIGNITREAMFWTPDGKRKEERPKITWKRLASAHLLRSEVQKVAQNRTSWRNTVEALCVAWREKDRR